MLKVFVIKAAIHYVKYALCKHVYKISSENLIPKCRQNKT